MHTLEPASLRPPEHPAAHRRRAGRHLMALALLCSAFGAFTVAAQTAPPRAGRATIDSNGDGALDEHELRAAAETTFETADADGNGYLTAEELGAARMAGDVERRTRGLGALLGPRGRYAETAAERFERLDSDDDARISRNEFLEAPHPLLRFDVDGDKRVTREEIEQARNALRPGVL